MKLSANFENLFEQGELEEIKRLAAKGHVPIYALERILNKRLKATQPNPDLLNDNNYSYKRTFYDGKASEIVFMLNLLTEGEKANDRAETK
jgi:hypothetical protein